ncbi:unnamed protein product [Caenorhabditis angaria]|uniref:SGNH hydrolase-type esterase domain-containing protein n=1 Tax=Caenorhabditis angaria TaxID=860376 RepID=A0A9P1IZF0_9PELO|nr:unnamed protein product [Caenorhabditis angaria]
MSQNYYDFDDYLDEPLLLRSSSSSTSPSKFKHSKKYLVLFAVMLTIFLLQMSLFKKSYQTEVPKFVENPKFLGAKNIAECVREYNKIIDFNTPENVDKVYPHHIKVLGALGDSITAGALSMIDDTRHVEFSFISGNEPIEKQISIYSILQHLRPENSTLLNYNFAQPGATSEDLMRQATYLASKIETRKQDWKIITIFIGTNDVGNLGLGFAPPIGSEKFRKNIENCLDYIEQMLPNTIVMLIGLPKPQLFLEARSLWIENKRARSKSSQKALDDLLESYQKVLYDLQEKYSKDRKKFSVVVQPFITEYNIIFTDDKGKPSKIFYSDDIFHPSKLGHSIMAKHLWINIFEPVGKKTTNATLGDFSHSIQCISKDNSLIRTPNNSFNK